MRSARACPDGSDSHAAQISWHRRCSSRHSRYLSLRLREIRCGPLGSRQCSCLPLPSRGYWLPADPLTPWDCCRCPLSLLTGRQVGEPIMHVAWSGASRSFLRLSSSFLRLSCWWGSPFGAGRFDRAYDPRALQSDSKGPASESASERGPSAQPGGPRAGTALGSPSLQRKSFEPALAVSSYDFRGS